MNQAVFTVLNLAIALVVPFASAWFAIGAAQRLAENESRRRDARTAFLRINEHTERYRLAMLQFHRAVLEWVPATTASHHDARAMAAHEFWAVHTALNGDLLLLHFIFGEAAGRLIDVLHELMAMYEGFGFENAPDFAAFNERVANLMQRVAEEMNTLWESL